MSPSVMRILGPVARGWDTSNLIAMSHECQGMASLEQLCPAEPIEQPQALKTSIEDDRKRDL